MMYKNFALILSLLLLTGCSAPWQLPVARDTTVIHYRDSVRIKDSLVFVNIPVESSSQVTFATDTSHLETSVARSDAWLDTAGRIHHTLNNKSDSKLPVFVPILSTARVSDSSHIITQIQTIEKPLTAWQNFRLKAFWVLAGIILLYIIIKLL